MSAEIIDFDFKKKPPGFYKALAMPPGIVAWLAAEWPDQQFQVFADPATGRLAGIVRTDLLNLVIAKAKGEGEQ